MKRYQFLTSIHPIIDRYIERFVMPESRVIDATLGNGQDSLKIAQRLGAKGHLYSFDIQAEAIERSRELLKEAKIDPSQVSLIHDSHIHFKNYLAPEEKIDFIIYNLGYLPRGDKSITTVAKSTLKSVEIGLSLLKPYGVMVIAVYHGHETGKEERDQLAQYLSTLDQQHYHVFRQQFINQKNHPPFLYLIERAYNPAAPIE